MFGKQMLANSEFLVMLNQSATDREELAKLLNISDVGLRHQRPRRLRADSLRGQHCSIHQFLPEGYKAL